MCTGVIFAIIGHCVARADPAEESVEEQVMTARRYDAVALVLVLALFPLMNVVLCLSIHLLS
jgi:hypothetical protein